MVGGVRDGGKLVVGTIGGALQAVGTIGGEGTNRTLQAATRTIQAVNAIGTNIKDGDLKGGAKQLVGGVVGGVGEGGKLLVGGGGKLLVGATLGGGKLVVGTAGQLVDTADKSAARFADTVDKGASVRTGAASPRFTDKRTGRQRIPQVCLTIVVLVLVCGAIGRPCAHPCGGAQILQEIADKGGMQIFHAFDRGASKLAEVLQGITDKGGMQIFHAFDQGASKLVDTIDKGEGGCVMRARFLGDPGFRAWVLATFFH